MSQASPILALPFLQPSQAQKHVTHNEALQRLDVLVQLSVAGFDATIPPAVPTEGEVYALGSGASGDWAGQDLMLAAFLDGIWRYFTPQQGWRACGKATGDLRVWSGTTWAKPDLNNLDMVGIATTADDTNRLAVQSAATLLSHDGAGHQLKINKSSSTDTASLLFQSNWSGHAEMGLAGDTDFNIKVSPNGSDWTDALTFEAATGRASGAAVQSDPGDTTPGRLIPVGGFGLGDRVLEYDSSDDLDTLRNLCALIGNSSGASVPANAPDTDKAFVGLTAAIDTMRGLQMLFETDGDRAFFRTDDAGWSTWRELVHLGRLIGTVSEDSGAPTGSVIERGTVGDGEYVRFADGTQICTTEIAVDVTTPAIQRWDYPMPFKGGRRRICSSFSHVTSVPNAALELDNIRMFGQDEDGWMLRLETAGISSSPGSVAETLTVMATGRWFT